MLLHSNIVILITLKLKSGVCTGQSSRFESSTVTYKRECAGVARWLPYVRSWSVYNFVQL